MAIKNSLAKTTSQTSNTITFKANGEDVKLSPKMIKDYLVAGNGQVTDQEVVMFLSLCGKGALPIANKRKQRSFAR